MNQIHPYAAIKEYQRLGTKGGIEDATPHRLIQMLMEGALGKIAAAKGYMQRGAITEKGVNISWAVSIIDGLRVSLDKSVGGEIARNLEDLYTYMLKRLTEANLKNQPAYLDEVAGLLVQIKSAWDAVPEDIVRAHAGQSRSEIPVDADAGGATRA